MRSATNSSELLYLIGLEPQYCLYGILTMIVFIGREGIEPVLITAYKAAPCNQLEFRPWLCQDETNRPSLVEGAYGGESAKEEIFHLFFSAVI